MIEPLCETGGVGRALTYAIALEGMRARAKISDSVDGSGEGDPVRVREEEIDAQDV